MPRFPSSSLRFIQLTLLSSAFLASTQVCLGSDRPLILDLKNGERRDGKIITPFMRALRQTIERHWSATGAPCDTEARIAFNVSPTGLLLSPTVVSSSGNADFDQSALNAVLSSSPFAAPPDIGETVLRVHATFDGNLLPKPAYRQRATHPVDRQSFSNYQPSQYSQQGQVSFADSQPEHQNDIPNSPKYRFNQTQQNQEQPSSPMPVSSAPDEASATGLSLGETKTFKSIPANKLQYLTASQITTYLRDLHEWLKQPLEDLLR